MLSRSESEISVRSPKNMLVRFSRDAPVDSGRSPSRRSRRNRECECTLQNQAGSPARIGSERDTYIYVYIYIYMCLYICIRVCIYIYI